MVVTVVELLSDRGPSRDRGGRAAMPVLLEGHVASKSDVVNASSPAADMRRWARLEPGRFENASGDEPRVRYQDYALAVLGPVHWAMVALQFMPALAVFEAVQEKDWEVELATQAGAPFVCTFRLGREEAQGAYPTPGSACVKGYLAALEK